MACAFWSRWSLSLHVLYEYCYLLWCSHATHEPLHEPLLRRPEHNAAVTYIVSGPAVIWGVISQQHF
eukprot:4775696-Prymnesium_polylepis.1